MPHDPVFGEQVTVGHQLIDRHSHEVYRSIGLGLELLPPAKEPTKEKSGYGRYRVSAKALEHARRLGVSGDIEAMVSRMAQYAAPVTHPVVNCRYDGFAMRVENGIVTWFGLFDQAARPLLSRKTK